MEFASTVSFLLSFLEDITRSLFFFFQAVDETLNQIWDFKKEILRLSTSDVKLCLSNCPDFLPPLENGWE